MTPSPYVPAVFLALLMLVHGVGVGALMTVGADSAGWIISTAWDCYGH